jgi:hypothetical protein
MDCTGGGNIEQADQIAERGLSRPRRAPDCDELPRNYPEAYPSQSGDGLLVEVISLAQLAKLD